jgi:hypothetical protein
MSTRRARFGSPSLLVALALAAGGCKKDAEPAPAEAGPVADASPTEDPASTPVPAQASPTDPVAPATAAGAPTLAAVAYPVGLDPLLDLVPAGSAQFGVVRDPEALLSLSHPFAIAVMRVLAEELDREAMTDALTKYGELRTALAGPELQLGKGMAVAEVGGEPVLIYAAATPNALTSIVAKVSGETDDSQCAAIGEAPGYVACARSAATLAAYAPGKKAAELRKEAAGALPGIDLERANVVALVASDRIPIVIETPPGMLQLSFGLPAVALDAATSFAPAKANALGLVPSSPAFLWLHFSVDAVKKRHAVGAPPFVASLLDQLTGEVFLGSIDSPPGLAMLAGVRDPAPIAGLMALAAAQLDQIPKQLPDGSKLEVALESVDLDGAKTQALHAVLTPSASSGTFYGALGLKTEAWAFAAGEYAGVVFGVEKAGLDTLVARSLTGPSAEAIAAVPPALGRALLDADVVLAMHMPFDGLATMSKEDLAGLSGPQPGLESAPFDPAQMMRALPKLLAPLSSISQWTSMRDGTVVGTMALSVFGDARSPDGKAALDVLDRILDGEDAPPLYAALAAAHGSSPRGHVYEARTGKVGSDTLVSVALIGVMAAIAIPAFQKYIERSKAAAAAVPPPP